MPNVNEYVSAATRENTRISYRAAIEHYEDGWGGFLPATADSIAQYLAHFAPTLAVSTLKQRLAALAAWHNEQGFPDPTKAPHVKKVLKGIAELHPHQEKQAKPIQLDQLSQIVEALDRLIEQGDVSTCRQAARNKALLLIGFWRAFRSDELARLAVENIQVHSDQGMDIFVPRSKNDHSGLGRRYKAPALQRLCPVSAYLDWLNAAQLKTGPVFRSINRWGRVADDALHPASIIGIIKRCCSQAGIDNAELFSSHSLRRGFATWANAQKWDTKTLMEYVGWKDVQSAIRYIDTEDAYAQQRISNALEPSGTSIENTQLLQKTRLDLDIAIERYSKHTRGMSKTRSLIERYCLSSLSMEALEPDGSRYRITIEHEHSDHLDEIIDDLLHRMHQIAGDNHCMLEATIRNQENDRIWD